MRKFDKTSLIKKKREENEQLENETKAIEQRLKLLKSALNCKPTKEVAPIEDNIWASSKPKCPQGIVTTGTIDLSKTRIRTLARSRDAPVKQSNDNVYGQLVQRLLAGKTKIHETQSHVSDALNAIKCGQCEEKQAVVACQECNEDYCARCFAQFHMKGALRRHHSVPISCKNSRNSVDKINGGSRKTNSDISARKTEEEVSMSESGIQHQGYQECLNRPLFPEEQTPVQTPVTTPVKREAETETTEIMSDKQFPIEVKFTSTLSYAERLMLRRHRREQLQGPEAGHNSGGDSEQSTIGETNPEPQNARLPQFIEFEQLHRLAIADFSGDHFQTLRICDAWPAPTEVTDPFPQPEEEFCTQQSAREHVDDDDGLQITSPELRESDEECNATDGSLIDSTHTVESGPINTGDDEHRMNLNESNSVTANKNELETINMIRRHLNLLINPSEHD